MAQMKIYQRTIKKADDSIVTDLQQASRLSDVSFVAIGYGDNAHVVDVQLVTE